MPELPLKNNSRVLVLSPHLDDALFSAAQLIEETGADVWTVFAGAPAEGVVTAWDTSQGFDSGREFVAVRRAEDLAAFQDHSGEVKHLDFLERAYVSPQQRAQDIPQLLGMIEEWVQRGEGETSYIFVPAGAGIVMPPPVWDRARSLLKRFSSESNLQVTVDDAQPETEQGKNNAAAPVRPAALTPSSLKAKARRLAGETAHKIQTARRRRFLRRGLLANEDHVKVRDVVLHQFSDRENITIGLYEDLPYLWDQRAQQQVEKISLRATAFELDVDRHKKCDRISRYETQVEAMDPVHKRLTQPETLPEREMYWLLP